MCLICNPTAVPLTSYVIQCYSAVRKHLHTRLRCPLIPFIEYLSIDTKVIGSQKLYGLTVLWRNILQLRQECIDVFFAFLKMYTFVRRGLVVKAHTSVPLLRRSNRPRGETATAVRADIKKFIVGTVGTEGAFI